MCEALSDTDPACFPSTQMAKVQAAESSLAADDGKNVSVLNARVVALEAVLISPLLSCPAILNPKGVIARS